MVLRGIVGFIQIINLSISLTNNSFFNDPYYYEERHIGAMNLESAWNIYKNNNHKVKVAILDSGIDKDSLDLNYCVNVKDSYCFNKNIDTPFFTNDNHGSTIASIIAAKQNDNYGFAGITNDIELYSMRVFDDTKNGNLNNDLFVKAVNKCQELDIDIINFSGYFTNDIKIKNAINNFDGLFITTAGNNDANIDIFPQYPASWDLDNILVVGSLNENGKISKSEKAPSNYGKKQ